jgi:hypothetical protein
MAGFPLPPKTFSIGGPKPLDDELEELELEELELDSVRNVPASVSPEVESKQENHSAVKRSVSYDLYLGRKIGIAPPL